MVAPGPGAAAGSAPSPAARSSSKRVLSGSSASAARDRDTRPPCPDATPPTRRPFDDTLSGDMGPHPKGRGSAGGRHPVENLLDHRAGVPGGAPVVIEELPGVQVGAVTARAGDAGQLDAGPG